MAQKATAKNAGIQARREELIRAILAAQSVGELQEIVADLPPEERNPLSRYMADAMDRIIGQQIGV